MIEKPLDQIELTDLTALVSSARAEGRRLDYKVALPSKSERSVKDFLADVTALANTDGGDIVYGVRENGNGVATELIGIDSANLDEEIRGFESQLRDCVDPRLVGVRVRQVALDPGRSALVLRVPASLVAPHRVIYAKSSRFYARNSRGNFEMDTTELRLAFAATSDLPRQMRDLHRHAVELLDGTDMPCRLLDAPACILTVAPLSVLREPRDLPMTAEIAVLPPRITAGFFFNVGLEGVVASNGMDEKTGTVSGWCYSRRRGYIDAAWTIGRVHQNGDRRVFRDHIEKELPGIVIAALTRLRSSGLEGPWVAMATLHGVRGFRLVVGDGYPTPLSWQDQPYLGQVVDEVMSRDALDPLLSAFWRVFGMESPPPQSR